MVENAFSNSFSDLYDIPIHQNIQDKINYFLTTKNIPHIIFHGPSGTGKKTIVYHFINEIYQNDKHKIKENLLHVNCAHGKGIKFIRDELKFFAMKNIQSNSGVLFKSIVLLDADFLTIDAQSALRRCIEQFSYNTRFFIIVENKHKLLNPILSRFCEIYVPEHTMNGTPINLHQYTLNKHIDFSPIDHEKQMFVNTSMFNLMDAHKTGNLTNIDLLRTSTEYYELGISSLDIIHHIEYSPHWSKESISEFIMEFYKVKPEYRCEKLLMFYVLNMVFMRLPASL